MDPGSYRSEYAAYCSAIERELYRHHAGLTPELRLGPTKERHSDLWTREAVGELRRRLDDTPAHFETERAGLRALVSAACLNYGEARAAEVTAELARCEAAAHVAWGGEQVAASDVPGLMAREADATRRKELAARWLDSLRPCDDLRAARLDALAEAMRAHDFAGRRAFYEDASGASLSELASHAESFLTRSTPLYMSHLARRAPGETTAAAPGSPSFGDEPFFRRAARLDAFFRPRGEHAAYVELMAGLGVSTWRQKNVVVDGEERPMKHRRAACFGVRPPDEVYLVAGVEGAGARSYTDFFFEAGRAQHFAWTSTELAARHPEFVRAVDDAARAAAGFLFKSLFYDAAWVGDGLGLRATEARELSRSVALLELLDARRDCAALRYSLALDEAEDVRAEQLSEIYVSLYGEATGFRYDPATHLVEAEDALAASATRLRARLLAASLREHLRGRHGRRWHASRAAGAELTDIWNVGLRHPAEELARLAWGGALDFDLLGEELKAALDVD